MAAEICTGVDVSDTNDYSRINALTYEVIEFISHFWPSIIKNVWVQKARLYCRDDWAEFRTQVTLKEVDEEIKALHESWDTQEAEDFYPGFQAVYFFQDNRDEPLGGEMGYSYELFEDKTENCDNQSS